MTWHPPIETQVELDPLALDPNGPRVVAVGGGHGLAAALQAAQCYASHITAVVSVADDGGSSGRLTAGLGIPPPGDIRRCLLALTPDPSIWYELFSYRFPGEGEDENIPPESRDVEGHSLGNLILAALTDLSGDFTRAVHQAGELLGAVGDVVPAAREAIRLSAMVGGRRVDGQVEVMHARGGIEQLILGPEGITAHPAALDAIDRADQVVLGPGSLFTSVMAAIRVPGIAQAIERSSAGVVLVLNLVTQDAETLGMTGADHVAALRSHGGLTRTGAVVAHHGELTVPDGLTQVTLDPVEAMELGWSVLHRNVVDSEAAWPAHDPIRLGQALAELAGNH